MPCLPVGRVREGGPFSTTCRSCSAKPEVIAVAMMHAISLVSTYVAGVNLACKRPIHMGPAGDIITLSESRYEDEYQSPLTREAALSDRSWLAGELRKRRSLELPRDLHFVRHTPC